MRRCGKKKLSFVFIFCSQAFIKERFMRSKRTCFCFPQTVICYLLSVPQKNHFWKLSTVKSVNAIDMYVRFAFQKL